MANHRFDGGVLLHVLNFKVTSCI